MVHAGIGFERLFELVEELSVDCHDAEDVIARFLARAVVDEILPPAFLTDPDMEAMGGTTLDKAKVLLTVRHAAARVEHVWGPGSSDDLADLKGEIRMLVEE